MPKLKIICFLLAAVLAAVGTVVVVKNLGGDDIPDFVKPTEDLNTYLDRTDDIVIDDSTADARTFLFVAHKVLLSGKGFYGLSQGTTTAMGVKQNVRNTRYVVGEFGSKNVLKEMVTKGVVSNAYQLFMYEDNYIYRKGTSVKALDKVTWADTAQALSEDSFYYDFGHRNDKLAGYILNWDTVTSGEFVEETNGVYTFRYVLNTSTATEYLRREMIFNGQLNSEPSFSKCVIYVSMDADFNIKTLRTDCAYQAETMGINAKCTEDITEVISPYEGELPNKEFFEPYFSQTPGGGIVKETTALDVLMDMFSPYIGGEALQVQVAASAKGERLATCQLSIDGLDISDLSKLTVNAKLGDVNLAYVHGNGTIYVKYQDFQGSTTVNGIMDFVSTLTPLLGGGVDSLALDGFDAESLLENLTYQVTDDKVVVSLPISLGGLTVDAKLYGDVHADGDSTSYTFSHAVINVGDVQINITPSAWTVDERTGEYPEILGLTDLVQNGKIALNADLTVGNYAVNANALIDIATLSVELNAQLGNNTVNVVYVDGVAYASFGDICVMLEVANIDSLLEIISKFTGVELNLNMPATDLSVQAVLTMLGGIRAIATDNGVEFRLSASGLDVALTLVNDNGRWHLEAISVGADGIRATVSSSDALGEVTKPENAADYADITEIAQTFEQPLLDIIHGNVCGADFDAIITLGSKQYRVAGSVVVDVNKTLLVNATIYDGALGIIDAQVVYANNTVFLTLNGVKVAFAVNGGSSIDVAQLCKLLDNAQIKQIIDSRDELKQLVEQFTDIVGVVANFKLDDLLDVNFAEIVTAFSFKDGRLSISLDGAALGLKGLALDITLAVDNGHLVVGVGGLRLANVGLDASATVVNSVDTIEIPDTDKYMLNLAGEILGAELQITADLVHMDIWASVRYGSEQALVRYVDGNVYLQCGGVALLLNTAELDSILSKLGSVTSGLPATTLDIAKVLAVLSAIKADLTGETPNVSLGVGGVSASVNFTKDNNKLAFSNVSVRFTLDGKAQFATIWSQSEQAEQLDVTGEFLRDKFVDLVAVYLDFADCIDSLVNAQGYVIGIDGSISLGGRVYSIKATVKLNSNVYVSFDVRYEGTRMIEGELWIVDNILYLQSDDLRLALKLDETDDTDTKDIKQILESVKGYNGYIDQVVQLVLDVLNTPVKDINFEQLLSSLAYSGGKLTLGLDGQQFGVNVFTLALRNDNGLMLSIDNFKYKDITLNVRSADINAFNGDITAPSGDFSTNVVIDVQDKNTNGEHNVIYVNIDLLKGVVLARIETTMSDGSVTFLDIKYTFADNVLKITNGAELNVLVNIDSIADIVDSINDIVNDFADAGDQALPDLFGSLGSDLDLKAIVQSLNIRNENGQVLVGLSAMGFKLTAAFKNGLKSVTVPIGLIESNLVVSFQGGKHSYSNFSDDINYVSIDQVFNDYYYGNGTQDEPNGAIYNLVHTNSWKFDFLTDSEIDVKNDDGTTTTYQIIAGSYIAFYYNKTEKDNIKVRAYLTVQKDRKEFLYLDVALFDGRIYVTYDSNKSNNKNDLKATVSLDAIKGTVSLLPALIKVVPQIGDLLDSAKEAMSSMQSKLTLGNVSKILHSVSYGQVNGKNVFTLQINGQAIDVNNFGKDPITLKVSNYGNTGLSLDELSLTYGNVSVNLANLVVTGSGRNAQTGEFEYVEKYIYSYNTANHINLDSIRELLSAFVITADNVDENGVRSFTIDGSIDAKLLGNRAIIGITIHVDIDKDNNVYLAVKLTRDAKGILSGAIYADDGGYSYMLLDTKASTISLYRNSYTKYTYCSWCKSWTCTSTILHAGGRKSYTYLDTEAPVGNQLPSFSVVNMPISQFTADTKTMVGYILDAINFGSLIDGQIRDAIGKENTNVYGIEDILKSYTYTYSANDQSGKFAIKVDLSPIDSALGDITANILHVGDLDSITCDEDGNLFGEGVQLTEINGTATMIKIMDATYSLTLKDAVSGRAYGYVTGNSYLW